MQRGHAEMFRDTEYEVDFVPKLMLTVVVKDELMENVIKAIKKVAFTGRLVTAGSLSVVWKKSCDFEHEKLVRKL